MGTRRGCGFGRYDSPRHRVLLATVRCDGAYGRWDDNGLQLRSVVGLALTARPSMDFCG